MGVYTGCNPTHTVYRWADRSMIGQGGVVRWAVPCVAPRRGWPDRPPAKTRPNSWGPPRVPNKCIKQAQNQPTTKPSPSQDSKLPCISELLAGDTNLWLSRTNIAGDYISAEPYLGRVGDARNPVKTSQQCLTAAPTNDPGEVLQQQHKLIVSAMSALTKIPGTF
ncbi:hypothetical protein PCANC_19658 [Puccinia coronata f. sp. avenae]|uniref:Uncharacterized protein n=1 Tax=Puccinia coronata f. sp. avenae TaxID=200324 RepID=A0A2N5SAS7_9BASI|nr:hypothetical protein PCANC_19658 [Puccinia coronata f. sp. avenae]